VARKIICPTCGAENVDWVSRCGQCNWLLPRRRERFGLTIILGIIGIGFFISLAAVVPQPQFFGLLAVPIIGLALSWKWKLAGGILLIIGGFLPYVGIMLIPAIGTDPFLGLVGIIVAIFITVPLLTCGILYILMGIRNRRR